jgi:hypothetical protein
LRIRQQYETLKQADTQPSSIVVSLETIAPILVLLAAGNVIGLLILATERRVNRALLKSWPPGNNLLPQKQEYRRSRHDRRLLQLHFM